MKTFEERYTAWIDGQLDGSALSAFEQELARRAAEGEVKADKAAAIRLRAMLRASFQAPPLTNPDFFSHQLRQRFEAERLISSRGRDTHGSNEPGLFAWGFLRLVGLGALSLFGAAAIYYGMMPPRSGSFSDSVAVNHGAVSSGASVGNTDHLSAEVAPSSSAPMSATQTADADGTTKYVQLAVTPSPIDLSSEVKAVDPNQSPNPATVTPLHYNQPNVNVLWLNGLEYLPSVSETDASTPAMTAPSSDTPVPSPAPSVNP